MVIDEAGAPRSNRAAFKNDVLAAILDRLPYLDSPGLREKYPTLEALANRMVDSLPDQYIAEPLLGPCYSTIALAKWKRVSRQAITRQRKIGMLFAVAHKGNFYFPSSQFDNRGRQMPAFRKVWARFAATGGNPLAFAVWLQTPDPDSGIAPAVELARNPDRRVTGQLFLEDFTVIEPPLRTPGAQS